jgi:HTH-type transcriptional regulator/antitoxin HigA
MQFMQPLDMDFIDLHRTTQSWSTLNECIFVPHTEEDYGRLVSFLDLLIDQVGEDETHPLASLMELLGVLIERYETDHIPELTD